MARLRRLFLAVAQPLLSALCCEFPPRDELSRGKCKGKTIIITTNHSPCLRQGRGAFAMGSAGGWGGPGLGVPSSCGVSLSTFPLSRFL